MRRLGLESGGALLRLVLAGLTAAALVPARAVRADEELYENQRVQAALKARALNREPQPAGKRIDFITVVRQDVFAEGELLLPLILPKAAPTWPNTFRFLTVEDVVRRELLFAVGDRYDAERIEESMRNLRALGIFALVSIVPVESRKPDSVGLLVYTRDLWSLRLETNFSGVGDALSLSAALTERNFLGRNKTLSARFFLNPKTFSVGEAFTDPRVLGGDLRLEQSFDVIWNRERVETEGSAGVLELGRPFRNLQQTWGWTAAAKYAVYVHRGLEGTEIRGERPGENGIPVRCMLTALPSDCMREVWSDESYSLSAAASYRRGVEYKQTFSLLAAVSNWHVAPNAETELRPDQEQLFREEILPFTRRQVYPALGYELWMPTYAVYENLSTYGKSENVRVGPTAEAGVRFPLSAFGSSTDSVVFNGEAGFVYGDGRLLAEASVSGEARLEDGRVDDQTATAVLRGATPPWLFGRLVFRVDWLGNRYDTARTAVTLGGDNGLRGYQSGQFIVYGGNRLRANVEYRTLPFVLWSVHVGAVAFYDAGRVYNAWADANPNRRFHDTVGVGLRVLFPQLNSTPFRLDMGFPLEGGYSISLELLSYGGEQAVPLTETDDLLLEK